VRQLDGAGRGRLQGVVTALTFEPAGSAARSPGLIDHLDCGWCCWQQLGGQESTGGWVGVAGGFSGIDTRLTLVDAL
jgi:hypothetical protein